jgi:hypothetical protein
VEEVHFPMNTAAENLVRSVVEGELFEDGRFEGGYQRQATGTLQYAIRSSFSREFTQRELDELSQLASSLIQGGRGSELQTPRGLDLRAEVAFGMRITSDRATRPNVGGGQILVLPIDNHANLGLVGELERELPRRTAPISNDMIMGPMTSISEMRLTLPEGWSAELPGSILAESRFGTYEATYVQEGRVLSVLRRVSGETGTAPTESFPELVDWFREISQDDIPFLLLRPEAP